MRQTYLRIEVIVLMLLVLSAPVYAQSLQYQFNHLSQQQIEVLKQSVIFGIKDNLAYSLAAISWQESDFGKYTINLQDPSAGWYHIKISTAMARMTPRLRNTKFNRNRVAQWLINDHKLSAKLAIAELRYWLKRWHGNWFKAIGSYNGGNRSNKRYARDIADKVRFLQKHVKF